MVERGWSYRRIAKLLGISKSAVGQYVHGEYGGDEVHEKREALRALELARLERIVKRLDKALRSTDDDVAVKACAALIKASESKRKLYGLDAPTRVEAKETGNDYAQMTAEQRIAAHTAALAEERAKLAGDMH